MPKFGSALLLAAAVAIPLFAQQPVFESIEVRVANVDVVVTDRDGKPVTGLTRDDFELLEDGQKQLLTNFYEVRGSTVTAPAAAGTAAAAQESSELRPRRFFLFLDATSLHPRVKEEVLSSWRKLIEAQMQPRDQVSVIAWSGEIQVLTPLTGDKAAALAAIGKLGTVTSPNAVRRESQRVQSRCTSSMQLGLSGRLPMRAAYLDCIEAATQEADATGLASRRLINALNVTLAMMGGVDGKKLLVVGGSQLPKKPGVETFQWANNLFSPYLTGFEAPRTRYKEDRPMVNELADLAQSANASGVTMYLLNAPIISDPMSAASSVPIDDQGLDYVHSANTGEAFADLARLTGGVAADHRFNSASLFTAIERDLGSYYSLGYRPREHGSNAKQIVVKTKNRAHTVRARQTFHEKTIGDQISDRVIANVFNPTPNPDWPIAVRPGAVRRDGKTMKVPLEVIIPSAGVTLLPEANGLAGGFTVWVAVGDTRGALSTVSRSPQVVNVPAAEEKAFRAEPLVFTVELTVRPGENIISVGVTDRLTNEAGFGRVVVKATE